MNKPTFYTEPKFSLQNLLEVCIAAEYGNEGVIQHRKHTSKIATNNLKAKNKKHSLAA